MSWPKSRLGTVCKIEKGITGINKAIPGVYPMVVTSEARKSHHEYQFDDDAVIIPLVSSTGHGHKSLKRIHFQQGKFALGSILCAVIPKDKTLLNAEYLYRYLDLNKDNELVSRMKGMANVTLPIKEIAQIEIPLPPINEQIEFTKKYHHLENNSESLSVQFSHQLDLLKKLRQQILQDAVQGKLVPQDPNDEPASVLLQKIKAEKEKLVQEKKIKKEKPLPPIKPEEIPFEIPENWVWCRLGELVTMSRGRFSIRPRNDSSYFGGIYPFIQIGSLDERGSVITDAPQSLNEKGFKVSKRFPVRRIGIATVGGTIGNLVDLGIAMCFTDSIVGILPSANHHQDFVLNYLRYIQPSIKKAAYQMSGQPNIKIPTLTELIVPLPPLPEQKRVVAKVDQLMNIYNELEQTIRQNQNYTRQLLQVALKEALEPGS
ncbi:MAG: restriction endonuclease subunit S [Bacteroidota bacterium]